MLLLLTASSLPATDFFIMRILPTLTYLILGPLLTIILRPVAT